MGGQKLSNPQKKLVLGKILLPADFRGSPFKDFVRS